MSRSQQLVKTAHTACHRTEASQESKDRSEQPEGALLYTRKLRFTREQPVKALYRAKIRALSLR